MLIIDMHAHIGDLRMRPDEPGRPVTWENLLARLRLLVDRRGATAVRDRVLNEIRSLPSQERRALKRLEKNVQSLLDFSEEHGTLRQR